MGFSKTVWQTFVTFGQNSSIAGLNNAAKSKTTQRALVWITAFIILGGFTAKNIYFVITDFYSHPITTTTELTQEKSVEFPAITVCNLNIIHCQHLLFHSLSERKVIEKITNATEKEARLKNAEILDNLFDDTGCKLQICTQIESFLSNMRKSPRKDDLVHAMVVINCTNTSERSIKMCYYWMMMDQDFRFNGSLAPGLDKNDLKTIRDHFQCNRNRTDKNYTAVLGCHHELEKEDDEEDKKSFKLPELCPEKKANENDNGQRDEDLHVDVTIEGSMPTHNVREKRQSMPDNDDEEREIVSDVKSRARFEQLYLSLQPTSRLAIGHQIRSMHSALKPILGFIQSCTYRGVDCLRDEYWVVAENAGFGNCFTFNAEFNLHDASAPRKASLTGMANGFSIQLYLDQRNYMLKRLSKKAGGRLVIHDPRTRAIPNEYGIDLQPNTASSISVQKNDVTRLGHPYKSNCTTYWNETDYKLNTSMIYTLASCQRYCLQKDIVDACGCFHPDMHQSAPGFEMKSSAVCNTTTTSSDYLCFKEVFDDHNSLKKSCPCHVACKETEFNTQLSVSTWPSNQYTEDFALELNLPAQDLKDKDKRETLISGIQNDYVKADIYYQTLNVRSIKQEAKYSGDGILAALGGALSLYLGVALVMIMEILELLFDLFTNVWATANGKKVNL